MNAQTDSAVHAIVPLALLQALQAQDVPAPDDLDEYHADLTTKRLGMSHTVARQIERYREMAGRNRRVACAEVVALMQLTGRRSDAPLLFADAGRRAASLAAENTGAFPQRVGKALPGFAERRVGFTLARKVLRSVFDVDLTRERDRLVARTGACAPIEATPNGAACGFYGSAVAATLRIFTDFDGAVLHEHCRATGAPECLWSTGPERTDA